AFCAAQAGREVGNFAREGQRGEVVEQFTRERLGLIGESGQGFSAGDDGKRTFTPVVLQKAGGGIEVAARVAEADLLAAAAVELSA
ncbi:MAG: hypothetical protein RQ826_16780, partial [Xanthomonadales bacterium]|nr:hypothetical protein [Xanthomonadales bacterium]